MAEAASSDSNMQNAKRERYNKHREIVNRLNVMIARGTQPIYECSHIEHGRRPTDAVRARIAFEFEDGTRKSIPWSELKRLLKNIPLLKEIEATLQVNADDGGSSEPTAEGAGTPTASILMSPNGINAGSQLSRSPDLALEEAPEELSVTAKKPRFEVPAWIRNFLPRHVGCGPKKLAALAQHFESTDALRSATFEELRIRPVGPVVAQRVRDYLDGRLPAPVRSNGDAVVEMWNTLTKRKLPYPSCPLEGDVQKFIQKYTFYERYDGQDQEGYGGVGTPDELDEDELISRDAYMTFCANSSFGNPREALVMELQENVVRHKLRMGTMYRARDQAASSACPTLSPLYEALSHAHIACGGELDARTLQGLAAKRMAAAANSVHPGEDSVIDVLEAVGDIFRRPIWVLIPPQEDGSALYVVHCTEQSPIASPVRLGHAGGMMFAPLFCEGDDLIPAPLPLAPAEDDEITPKQLPELKSSLRNALTNAIECVEEIQTWSKEEDGKHEIDLTTVKDKLEGFLSRLRCADGLMGAVVGTNNTGKSTLLNLMLLNSSIDQQAYGEAFQDLRADETYIPEAIVFAEPDDPANLPSLSRVLTEIETEGEARIPSNDPKLCVRMLSTWAPGTVSRSTHDPCIHQIKQFCITKQFSGFKNFIFPCGKSDEVTTFFDTCVRYGQVVQLVIQLYSADELKSQCYHFISLLDKCMETLDSNDLAGCDMSTRLELEETFDRYRTLTTGNAGDEDGVDIMDDVIEFAERFVSDRGQYPDSSHDVILSDAVVELIQMPQMVYIGSGDLAQDREMLSNEVEAARRDALRRRVTRSFQLYEPTALLEGGTGLIDLPGTNSSSPIESMHTVQGVRDAGVVFVLLQRNLTSDNTTLEFLRESGVIKRVLLDKGQVVFLFNREMNERSNLGALEESLGTEGEKRIQADLEASTRKAWTKELQMQAGSMFHSGDLCEKPSKEAIQEISNNTQFRSIYPMLHTAWKMNKEWAAKYPEAAQRIFDNSNMNWLLGLLEKLNRDEILQELHMVATKLLVEVREKVVASVNDAQHINGELPDSVVRMANQLLSSKRNEGFKSALSELKSKVEEMSVPFRKAICKSEVEEFLDADFKQVIIEAESRQAAAVERLNAAILGANRKFPLQINRFMSARGTFRLGKESLFSIIFGNDWQRLELRFDRLHDAINRKLAEMKEKVIDIVLEVLDKQLLQQSSSRSNDTELGFECSVQQLRETFQAVSLLPLIERRFGQEFFSRKQVKVHFIQGHILKAFDKMAKDAAISAMDGLVNEAPSNRGEIVPFLSEDDFLNLMTTRNRWESLLWTDLKKLLSKQFGELVKDLTEKGGKSRHQGLLESLLHGFLTHVVKMDKARTNEEYCAQVKEKSQILTNCANELYNLWAQVHKQEDPEELGKYAARYLESMRERPFDDAVPSEVQLPRPSKHPVASMIYDGDVQENFVLKNMYLSGAIEHLNNLQVRLEKIYGLRSEGFPPLTDIFSAAAVACWNEADLSQAAGLDKSRNMEAIAKVSSHLRGIAVHKIKEYISTRAHAKQVEISNTIGKAMEQYYQDVQLVAYPGDLFCLWAVAQALRSNFRVWLPGSNRCVLIRACQSSKVFNIIIVGASGTVEGGHFYPAFKYKSQHRGGRLQG